MSVLIITRQGDNGSVEMVSSALRERGEKPVRLDSDLYPQEIKLSSRLGTSGGCFLTTAEGRFDVGEVSALWYRRFFTGGKLPAELGDTREACVAESCQTLYGTIASLKCFQLDRLSSVRRADHKEVQLQKACELGLEIPDTLISNDPEEVPAFFHRHRGNVVTKTQSSFAIYRDGEEQVVFTSAFREEHLKELEGLRYSPMMFQERVAKRVELRATVVGRRVFTAMVDSQKHELSAVDWRRDGVGLIDAWEPYQLPPEVECALLGLCQFFGLNYGAADLVVTPEGRHVFLEINAGGEWFWLQPILPIAEALADVLTGRAERCPVGGVGLGGR